MTLIAVLVCLFAVGMAGLLNFFKYRSTSERIVHERLVAIGDAIENSIQQSMALGLQFAELKALPSTMERERVNDDLIVSIDVYDTDGQPLYSTDRLRATTAMPPSWLVAAHRAGANDWFVSDDAGDAAGIVLENNFGLRIGYLAMRFSNERLQRAHWAMARELALTAAGIFAISALLAAAALTTVKKRLHRNIDAIRTMLRSNEVDEMPPPVRLGPFGGALRKYFDSVHRTEARIAALRGQVNVGAQR